MPYLHFSPAENIGECTLGSFAKVFWYSTQRSTPEATLDNSVMLGGLVTSLTSLTTLAILLDAR